MSGYLTSSGHVVYYFISRTHHIYIITLLPFFIEMLQYDWL